MEKYDKIEWPKNAELYFSELVRRLNERSGKRGFTFKFKTIQLYGDDSQRLGAHFFVKEIVPKRLFRKKVLECYASEGRHTAVDRIIIMDKSLEGTVNSVVGELKTEMGVEYPIKFG